jgi:hypothetical protein
VCYVTVLGTGSAAGVLVLSACSEAGAGGAIDAGCNGCAGAGV